MYRVARGITSELPEKLVAPDLRSLPLAVALDADSCDLAVVVNGDYHLDSSVLAFAEVGHDGADLLAAIQDPIELEFLLVCIELSAETLETITFSFKNKGRTLTWESHIILTNEQVGEPQVQDLDERITDFREVSPCELNNVADQLENLPPGHWGDWGRFRAVEHTVVYNRLCRNSS